MTMILFASLCCENRILVHQSGFGQSLSRSGQWSSVDWTAWTDQSLSTVHYLAGARQIQVKWRAKSRRRYDTASARRSDLCRRTLSPLVGSPVHSGNL